MRQARRAPSVLAGPLARATTTIHKSQGSEYPAVVIPLVTQHYMMLARNLLYTGVTRGKRLVVLVGQRKALAIAVPQPRLAPALGQTARALDGDPIPKAPKCAVRHRLADETWLVA